MVQDAPIQSPLSWTSPSFSLDPYNLLFFPGGHEKGVRQVIDATIIHEHLTRYFPQTLRSATVPTLAINDPDNGPSKGTKSIAAVCHGVMVLAEATHSHSPSSPNTQEELQQSPGEKLPVSENAGQSLLWDVETTALPAFFEHAAFWGTRLFLGDYYKTYGAGSPCVEHSVSKRLRNKKQWKGYAGFSPFVVEDRKYRYMSGRWPGDAALLAEKVVGMVKEGWEEK